jgi:hypothetical protein
MTPERWQRIEHLYRAALEREPNRRLTYVAEARGEDDGLQKKKSNLCYD